MRLGRAKIDVGAKRLQRQPPLQIPFLARDFRAVQPPGDAHLDSLAAESQRRIDRLAHRPPERHALFKLQRNGFRHQLGIKFRTVHFLNVDVHFALGALLHFALELVDFRALAADDDSRARSVNPDDQLVGRALDIDPADTPADFSRSFSCLRRVTSSCSRSA